MKLLNLALLRPLLRIVRATERIADALDRAYPPLSKSAREPTDGLSIVTNETVLEEEMWAELRSRGFLPDDVDKMVSDYENESETAAQ